MQSMILNDYDYPKEHSPKVVYFQYQMERECISSEQQFQFLLFYLLGKILLLPSMIAEKILYKLKTVSPRFLSLNLRSLMLLHSNHLTSKTYYRIDMIYYGLIPCNKDGNICILSSSSSSSLNLFFLFCCLKQLSLKNSIDFFKLFAFLSPLYLSSSSSSFFSFYLKMNKSSLIVFLNPFI